MKCWDLLLKESCNKLFSLMDSFWVEISGKRVDICWLVKVRGQLGKVETEQQGGWIKKDLLFQVILALKMVFEQFNENLTHFKFKADFLLYFSSQCPELENIYPLTTIHKTYKNHEKMNDASQTCQYDSGLVEVLNTKDKKNEIVLRISTIVKKMVMFWKKIT